MRFSYPWFEGQENFGQKEDEAFQGDGNVLQDKISDAHHPDQIKEVKAAEVGLGKNEAGWKRKQHLHDLLSGGFGVFTGDGRLTRNSEANV